MSRFLSVQRSFFISIALTTVATAWWGCAASPDTGSSVDETSSSSGSSSSGSSSSGIGGFNPDGGPMPDDSGACTSTEAKAERIQLDIIFLIDKSGSMSGPKWTGTVSALTKFWNDAASNKIGAGIMYFPNNKPDSCVLQDYLALDVPIDVLPMNAFALTNSLPADATGSTTPTFGALEGALMVATAHQDTHPKRKVILVLATDGDPNACGSTTIDDIAYFAKSARNYNGVLTYVIGVQGSTIANLNKIAAAGGTTAAYDVTNDIAEFAAKMEEIRGEALGCEFEVPPPPDGKDLDPDKVNISYTPKGMGMSKVLPRANDVAACKNLPGWYYDDNSKPTKFILCPASCSTVQADSSAEITAYFGCKFIPI